MNVDDEIVSEMLMHELPVGPGLSDGQGNVHALFTYKVSKFVNADMDDEIVPEMLLLRLILQGFRKI